MWHPSTIGLCWAIMSEIKDSMALPRQAPQAVEVVQGLHCISYTL